MHGVGRHRPSRAGAPLHCVSAKRAIPPPLKYESLLATILWLAPVASLHASDASSVKLTAARMRLSGIIVEQTGRVLDGSSEHLISPDRLQLERLTMVLEWIQSNLDSDINNDALAEQLGVSESHFRHVFLAAMGVPPSRYVQQRRLERARELLSNTNVPIGNVASACGFQNQSYMTTCFKSAYGLTPARFRRTLAQV